MNIEHPIFNIQEAMLTRTAYTKQADKNDGVVTTHSVLWSEDDLLVDDNNQLFSDVEIDENGNDVGGYNHFELRHYERPYTLPGEFNKGDRNPSMEELQKWIENGYELDVQN